MFMPKKLILSEFIEKSNKIHNNKFDYSKSIYVNANTKMIIICPTHGEFLSTPYEHTKNMYSCALCDPTYTLGNEKFIEKAITKHGNLYDYSKVNYIKNDINVEIICNLHGSFMQKPGPHLRGQGCPNCVNNKKSNTEEFAEKAIKIHGNKYDYSLVEYTTKKEKVKIICNLHGIFEQKAYVHLSGHGCKICRNSKMELYLRKKLIYNNINFLTDYRFDDCRNVLPLPFDFYLTTLNILIECDGIQHHKSIEYFGGEERFKYQKINDEIKTNYCKNNNLLLYRVNSLTDIDSLLNDNIMLTAI